MRPAITKGSFPATWAAAALVWCLSCLSGSGRARLAAWVGRAGFFLGIRRAVTLDNLRHAFPEKTEADREAIARGAYENMALTAVEAVTSHLFPDDHLDFSPMAHVARRMRERQPTLLASAHLGSWELFADLMVRQGHPVAAVVRPLSGAFNARVVEGRLAAGLELILQRGALRQMLKAVKRGTPVVQLIDQVVPADVGVFAPFFGRPASTAPSLAAVALRTGAPLYVVAALRQGGRLVARCEGPVTVEQTGDFRADAARLTEQLTAIVERWIREAPEQWLWLHRRWKVQPPGDQATSEGTSASGSAVHQSASENRRLPG